MKRVKAGLPTNFITLPGTLTRTSWEPPEGLPFIEWETFGTGLRLLVNASPWWIGDWLRFGERKYGEKYTHAMEATGKEYSTLAIAKHVAERFEFLRRRKNLSWAHHRDVAPLDPSDADKWLDRAERENWGHKELRAAIAQERIAEVSQRLIDQPTGRYLCLVIDPPWPMEKISREVRPRQFGFDYPTMDEAELADFPVPELAEADCHLYCWVTQKFLPMGLRLVAHWGFEYQCLLTWVKNVGFTPFSWMYSTEHVIFARKGSLDLLARGRRLDFRADVREHSRKPEEFYELVRAVSPGPRLDIFSRGLHEGFEQYGKEKDMFTAQQGVG